MLLGVGDTRLVEQMTLAAKVGARGAVVFGSAHAPGVRDEIRRIAVDAGMALVGAGCMGFWNVRRGVRAMGYTERDDLPVGPVSLVTHSGSIFSTLLRTRLRLGFDLAVSSGQELVTTTADYVDHVVAHTDTRVLALVLETIRDGDRLRWSLRRAREAGIEVVLLPVGHSPLGSAMVAAHSGAVAGGSAAWEALADDVAGHLVDDLAELTDTLALLASPRRPRRGGALATVHDSGAERSLVADLAHGFGVPFATLAPETRAALAARLDDGLEADNPLDVWGGGADTHNLFAQCLTTLAADPAVGVTALAVDLVPGARRRHLLPRRRARRRRGHRGAGRRAGRAARRRRRRRGRPAEGGRGAGARELPERAAGPAPPAGVRGPAAPRRRSPPRRHRSTARCSRRTASRPRTSATPPTRRRCCARPRSSAGRSCSRPRHPASPTAPTSAAWSPACTTRTPSRAAYADLAARLGPDVTVHQQVPAGVELSVGIVRDDALGPMVVVAAGGVLVELLADRAVALPPLTHEGALRMLDRLRLRPLLDGFRGAPPVDLDALADMIVKVARLAADHGGDLDALDLNPVVATAEGAVAVDVLIVPNKEETPT